MRYNSAPERYFTVWNLKKTTIQINRYLSADWNMKISICQLQISERAHDGFRNNYLKR